MPKHEELEGYPKIPHSVSRNITLNEIEIRFGKEGLERAVSMLKAGNISAEAYTWELYQRPGKDVRLPGGKQELTIDDWRECTLSKRLKDGVIYLANSESERAHSEITLKRSQINRLFKVTGQSGGQPPKMGSKFYGFLAALWAVGEIHTDTNAEDLFTELEDRTDIWDEREPISARIGVPEVRDFIRIAENVSQQLAENRPLSDISITSTAEE